MTVQWLFDFSNWFLVFIVSPNVGAGASVIGAIFSTRVWFSVRAIRQKVLLRQRAPEAVVQIKHHASSINDLLQDFAAGSNTDAFEAIDTEINLSYVTLKSIVEKLHGTAKDESKRTIEVISDYRKLGDNGKTRVAARKVYTALLSAALAIDNLVADTNQEV